MYANHYHIFIYLSVPSFNGKGKKKNDLTKKFIKLGKMPESISSDDKNTLEFLVETVYFRNVKDIENVSLNEMKNVNFKQSTSNGLKRIAPNFDALNMHSLKAAHAAGFKWVEFLHNDVAEFLQTCKWKTAKHLWHVNALSLESHL